MDFNQVSQSICDLLSSGKSYILLLVQVLVIFLAGYLFSRWLSARLEKFLLTFKQADETLVVFFTGVVRYLIIILTVVVCIGKLGIQTTSIITVLGTAGLAIGLALQSTLTNIASGIIILILRPFKIGEYIEAGDAKGTVVSIGLFATQLKDLDGIFLMAPNTQLWNKTIRNLTRNDLRRIVIPVGISYNDHVAQAQQIILDFLSKEELVLKDPAPQVLVDLLDSSSVNLQIRLWVQRADYTNVKSDITDKVKKNLIENGIAIPFPQREVTVFNK